MNALEPIAVMEKWVRESGGVFAVSLAISLGVPGETETVAIASITDWIGARYTPRRPYMQRGVEVSLRAIIDFECALASSSKAQQAMIDEDLLAAVDDGNIPVGPRSAINRTLGNRPEERRKIDQAVEQWRVVRPSDQVILQWCDHRLQDEIQRLTEGRDEAI